MSVYPIPDLKDRIDLYIKTNGVKAITGALLNTILNDTVDSLEDYTDDEIATAVADLVSNSDLTTALANYLLKSGGTMTGNLDMQSFQLLVNQVKAAAGLLFFINAGNNALVNDITALNTNRTIAWRDLAGTPAFLDDIKNKTIISTVTPSSHTGNTTETVLTTLLIPANTFVVGDMLTITWMAKKETIVAAVANSLYLNTTANLSGTPLEINRFSTNNRTHKQIVDFVIPSTGVILSLFNRLLNSNRSINQGGNNVVEAALTGAVDWTVTQYLVFSTKLANSSETSTLKAIFIERKRQ